MIWIDTFFNQLLITKQEKEHIKLIHNKIINAMVDF